MTTEMLVISPETEVTEPVQEVEQEAEQDEQLDENGEPIEPVVKRSIKFVDHDFEIPEGTPAEIAEQMEAIGKQLQAGFTQKTQSVAEERRALQAQAQQFQQQMQVAQSFADEMVELRSIDAQLKAYNEVNWQTYADQDPVAAQKHFMQYTALQNQRSEKAQGIEVKQREMIQRQQQGQEALLAEGRRVLSEKITDWGEAKQQHIAKHATESYGFKPEELSNVMDPRVVLMMHDAYLYRQSMQKAQAKPQTPKPEPVQKVGSTAPVAKTPDKMSDKEWMEWRERQVKRKR